MKSHPVILVGITCLALAILPLLACNLPARQSEKLVFPTSGPPPTLEAVHASTPVSAGLPSAQVVPSATALSTQAASSLYPFLGMQTATPGPGTPGTWTIPEPGANLPPYSYWTQPGDTLSALSARFGVTPDQIAPPQPSTGFLQPGQELSIPNLLGESPYPDALLPDSAVIYSPLSASFDTAGYISQAGGYLASYEQKVDDEWLSGPDIVSRVATDTSVSPQLLLAFLELRSGWVRGQPRDPSQVDYPIGFYVPEYKGLYFELSFAAKQLNLGYYGWRQGTFLELTFPDSSRLRVSPSLNAGSVAVENLTSKFYLHKQDWLDGLHGPHGLLAVYNEMFGDPWVVAANVEPLFPPGLTQPALELPFAPGELWSLTSGPHIAWNTGTPRGALDFAPITGEPACAVSTAWVRASAPGLVVRAARGAVVLDLDGDGLEQTGWALVYMHVAEQDRVPLNTWVETDQPLGHPSCEGGAATGTNVHLARKYNGEWLAADGPLPMILSGWVAHEGKLSYEGTLERDGKVVSAHPDGSSGSTIIR